MKGLGIDRSASVEMNRLYFIFGLMLLCTVAGAQQQQREGVGPPSTHTVKPGETLWDISGRYIGQTLRWPFLQRRNGIAEPRQLQVGQVLQLSTPYAIVVAATGNARADGTGRLLVANDRVAEGSVVRTGPDSFLSLRMPDGSRTSLPSNSIVKLVRLRPLDGRNGVQIQLDAGDVEARVPSIKNRKGRPWEVQTRIATVGVRGTHFRVSVPEDGSAAISVLQSAVAVDALGHGVLQVPEAKGLVANAGRRAASVEDLLAAPAWRNPGEPQGQQLVQLAWERVVGASAYHVQLSRDVDFSDVFAEQRLAVSGGLEASYFDGVPNGSYFARVTALTSEGLEGIESIASFVRTRTKPPVGSVPSISESGEVELSWTPVPGALYTLEISDDPTFDRLVVRQGGMSQDTVRVQALPPGRYWWRVVADIFRYGQHTRLVGTPLQLGIKGVR